MYRVRTRAPVKFNENSLRTAEGERRVEERTYIEFYWSEWECLLEKNGQIIRDWSFLVGHSLIDWQQKRQRSYICPFPNRGHSFLCFGYGRFTPVCYKTQWERTCLYTLLSHQLPRTATHREFFSIFPPATSSLRRILLIYFHLSSFIFIDNNLVLLPSFVLLFLCD